MPTINSGQNTLAIIGGSGCYSLTDEADNVTRQFQTPYADTPITLFQEVVEGHRIWFLPRHGKDHGIAPHRINYRANLHALHQAGVKHIIAVNAVGGIHPQAGPGRLVIPEQIIDYTWGREHTFFDGPGALDHHVDFTSPYDAELSQLLTQGCLQAGYPGLQGAVYGCTQGPRLESAAEINKLRQDGCDIVGMTAMPEAALARELNMAYASIALVVNWAAGITEQVISNRQIRDELESGMEIVKKVLLQVLTQDSNPERSHQAIDKA